MTLRAGGVRLLLPSFGPATSVVWLSAGAALLGGVVALAAVGAHAVPFGFTFRAGLRTWVVFTVFAYLALVLWRSGSRSSVTPIMLLPFVAHFYQLTLGWDVPVGVNSLARQLPLLAMAAAMAVGIARDRPGVKRWELLFFTLWIGGSLVWTMASLGLTDVAWGGFFLTGILVPTFYFFVKGCLRRDPQSPRRIVAGLGLGFLLLVAGTVLTSLVGLDYYGVGASDLVRTRNVNDGNTLLGYALLLWPFALLAGRQWSRWLLPLNVLTFGVMLGLSFSRGGLLTVAPLLVLTLALFVTRPRVLAWTLASMGAAFGVVWLRFGDSIRSQVLFWWTVRLTVYSGQDTSAVNLVMTFLGNVGDQLETAKRLPIWEEAWKLFLQSPLIGNGLGSFQVLGPGYAEAHSLLFQVLAEMGGLGFVLIYGAIGFVLLAGLRRLVCARRGERLLAVLLLASFGAWLVLSHATGSAFLVIAATGLRANALGAMLLMLYLQADTLLAKGSTLRPL